MNSSGPIHKTITINAPTYKVWAALTTPELIRQWQTDDGGVEVLSDFKVGSPIRFEGRWHTGVVYKDKGTILKFEPEKVFQYTYWSEISHLPDTPENYIVIEFTLEPEQDKGGRVAAVFYGGC
jgi:uncharacterized protein YndB with AHSA1/START domain